MGHPAGPGGSIRARRPTHAQNRQKIPAATSKAIEIVGRSSILKSLRTRPELDGEVILSTP